MTCAEVRAWLRLDLDGAAEPWAEAAEHLASCAPCAAEARRLRALADAVRAALPPPEMPADFPHRVLAAAGAPTGDAVLERAARTRAGPWLLGAALIVAGAALFAARGRSAEPVRFALASGGVAETGGVRADALAPTSFRGGVPLALEGGAVALESRAPALVVTAAGRIRLESNTRCLAVLAGKEGLEMKEMRGLALAVVVLAGGASVANGRGGAAAEEGGAVVARPDEAPRRTEEIVKRLEAMEARLHRLEAEGARGPSGRRLLALDALLEKARAGDAEARWSLQEVAEEIRRAVHGEPVAMLKPAECKVEGTATGVVTKVLPPVRVEIADAVGQPRAVVPVQPASDYARALRRRIADAEDALAKAKAERDEARVERARAALARLYAARAHVQALDALERELEATPEAR